jgi:putative sterol carrier protein
LIYLDFWRGECYTAFLAQDERERTPDFHIAAPAKNWQRVIMREVGPIISPTSSS